MDDRRVLEGVDHELEQVIRVLRRRREHDAWPARTSSEFEGELAALANEARVRGEEVSGRLEAAMARHPSLEPFCRSLLAEFEEVSTPLPQRRCEVPLASWFARQHDDEQLRSLMRTYEEVKLGDAGASRIELRHRALREWVEGEDELAWCREVARAELRELVLRPRRKPEFAWLGLLGSFAAQGVLGTTVCVAVTAMTWKLWLAYGPAVKHTGFGLLGESAGALLGGLALSLGAGVAAGFSATWLVFSKWLGRKRG